MHQQLIMNTQILIFMMLSIFKQIFARSIMLLRVQQKKRFVWDFFILILITLGTFVIPMQIAFPKSYWGDTSTIIYFIDLFFLTDIFLNLKTTYFHQGIEITDPNKISKQYFKNDFYIDFISILPFDLLFIHNKEQYFLTIPLYLIFRLNRLLRLFKIRTISKRWSKAFHINKGYIRIFKVFFIVCCFIHFIACAWFIAGKGTQHLSSSWALTSNILNLDWFTQYIRSIYWTVTTATTVGYGDITPQNNVEYIFTILTMGFGASLYAFFIGNIAALISSIDVSGKKFWNNVEATTNYLSKKNVPKNKIKLVENYYEYMWARHKGIQKYSFIDDLSYPLKLEIMESITGPILNKIPLFKLAPLNLKNELLLSLKPQSLMPDMVVSNIGESGNQIYLIAEGTLAVYKEGQSSSFIHFNKGDIFGLLPIILKEKKTGIVKSIDHCELFCLGQEDFKRIKNEYPEFIDVLKSITREKNQKNSNLIMEGIIV